MVGILASSARYWSLHQSASGFSWVLVKGATGGGKCTADKVGSSKEPKTTVQLWGDVQVCELLPRSDEKNQLEAKQLADKQEK